MTNILNNVYKTTTREITKSYPRGDPLSQKVTPPLSQHMTKTEKLHKHDINST